MNATKGTQVFDSVGFMGNTKNVLDRSHRRELHLTCSSACVISCHIALHEYIRNNDDDEIGEFRLHKGHHDIDI